MLVFICMAALFLLAVGPWACSQSSVLDLDGVWKIPEIQKSVKVNNFAGAEEAL